MPSKWIEVETADGHMHSYVSEPSGGGPYPGIVVLQEAFGVNAYVRSVCDRLADAGYVAIAPELFHRSGTHIDIPYTDRARLMEVFGALSNDTIEEDVGAAVAALRAIPEVDPVRLGTLGFCMGGFSAILGGLTTAVAAVVAFYPGGLVHERPPLKMKPLIDRIPQMKAATLINFGGDDASITTEQVEQVRKALGHSPSRHEVMVWPGAKHGFHSDDRADVYDPASAEQAWHKTLAWLHTMLRTV